MSTPLGPPVDSDSDHPDYDTSTPRKRARVSEACGACRDRKTRCDGQRPVCYACQSRGIEARCEYSGIQRRQRRPLRRPARTPAAISHPPPASTGDNQSLNRNTAARPWGLPVETNDEHQPWASTHTDGLATFAGRDDESIYGPSSTVAFLRHVLAPGVTQGSPTPGSKRHAPKHIPDRIPERNDAMAILPRRRIADDFLSCYWEFIHPMFPVLHKQSFTQQYERFWLTESVRTESASPESETESTILLSTMNVVFALGCKFSNLIPAAQKLTAADEFYQKSRQMFVFDILDSASLPIVQMLVLVGVYLQSTQHASRCWNTIGLAIRAAQGLGLHLDPNPQAGSTQVEVEMKRRIWYTCVNLDRLLGMTFGRPTMIRNAKAVSIPALIDDEYLSGQRGVHSIQPGDIPSRLGLFVSSCSLLELLEEVLSFLSKHESGIRLGNHAEMTKQRATLVMRVLDLNRRLDEFSATVPSYLRPPQREAPGPCQANHVNLQQQVLYCRFLLTRLLLLRPLLLLSAATQHKTSPAETLDGEGQARLDKDMVERCCELCVQTAYRLVDTIHDNLGTLYRSSGWHAVYFTFSAAIVLLGALKSETLNVRVNEASFEDRWARCLNILQHYRDQVPAAEHAIYSLDLVRKQILQMSTRQQSFGVQERTSEPSRPTDGIRSNQHHPEPSTVRTVDMNDQFSIENLPEDYFGLHLTNLDWLDFFQT